MSGRQGRKASRAGPRGEGVLRTAVSAKRAINRIGIDREVVSCLSGDRFVSFYIGASLTLYIGASLTRGQHLLTRRAGWVEPEHDHPALQTGRGRSDLPSPRLFAIDLVFPEVSHLVPSAFEHPQCSTILAVIQDGEVAALISWSPSCSSPQ